MYVGPVEASVAATEDEVRSQKSEVRSQKSSQWWRLTHTDKTEGHRQTGVDVDQVKGRK
jgi:hypothetical protein